MDTVLGSWGLDPATAPVQLLVSELVTNAVLHARTGCTVRLIYDDSHLRVEVGDGNPAAPSRRRYSEQSGTGRGLALVEALAQDWGVDSVPDGKVVWFVLDPHAEAAGDGDEAIAAVDAPQPRSSPRSERRSGGVTDSLLRAAA